MFDRFSEDARNSMSAARQAAFEFRHDYIGTEHVLLGVLATDGSVAAIALRKLGVDAARVRDEVTKIVKPGASDTTGQLPFTPRGKRVLEFSLEEAQEAGHRHIGTGHLLLGLLREGDDVKAKFFGRQVGIAAQVLGKLGLTLDKARPVVMDVMRAPTDARDGPPTRAPTPVASEALRTLMAAAAAESMQRGRATVEPEHVLVAMLEGDGVVARVLEELGATPDGLRKRVQELKGP